MSTAPLTDAQVLQLVARVGERHPWMHFEKLLEVDGKAAYTRAQGEQ